MSLIDEALKRARHEASRQEAVKRDAARHDGPRPIPKLYAERGTSRAPIWAGIATGAAVALLGVVAWLLWGRAPVVPPVAAATAEAPKAVSVPSPQSAAPAASTLPSAPTAPPPAAASGPPASSAPVREPAPRSLPSAPPPSAPAATPAAPHSAAPPPRERTAKPAEPSTAAPKPISSAPRTNVPAAGSSAAPGAPQTYVREVALPGGGPHFRLGGIAYSAEAPIALINGAALGKGEVVEGYVVRRIDAAEVELEGPGGRVVLRLK